MGSLLNESTWTAALLISSWLILNLPRYERLACVRLIRNLIISRTFQGVHILVKSIDYSMVTLILINLTTVINICSKLFQKCSPQIKIGGLSGALQAAISWKLTEDEYTIGIFAVCFGIITCFVTDFWKNRQWVIYIKIRLFLCYKICLHSWSGNKDQFLLEGILVQTAFVVGLG